MTVHYSHCGKRCVGAPRDHPSALLDSCQDIQGLLSDGFSGKQRRDSWVCRQRVRRMVGGGHTTRKRPRAGGAPCQTAGYRTVGQYIEKQNVTAPCCFDRQNVWLLDARLGHPCEETTYHILGAMLQHVDVISIFFSSCAFWKNFPEEVVFKKQNELHLFTWRIRTHRLRAG